MAECELTVAKGTQLYVSVNGPTRGEYSLVYRDSPGSVTQVSPTETTTPDTTGQVPNMAGNFDSDQSDGASAPVAVTGSGRSGGGSVTFFLLLSLLVSVIDRSFSGRRSRV